MASTRASPASLAARVVDRRRTMREEAEEEQEEVAAAAHELSSRTTASILAKFKDVAPSLLLHLYPTHFRFEQQEGVFLYHSPMKYILEFIRQETIPPDGVEVFSNARVPYYEGCLVVEVRDHRLQHPGQMRLNLQAKNEHITPAPGEARSVSTAVEEKEDSGGKGKVYRTVLHPSPESLWADMCLYTELSKGRFDDEAAIVFEAQVLVATSLPLVLDTPSSPRHVARLIQEMGAREGAPLPSTQKQKAPHVGPHDEEARASEERLMLIMDEKQGRDFQPKWVHHAHMANVGLAGWGILRRGRGGRRRWRSMLSWRAALRPLHRPRDERRSRRLGLRVGSWLRTRWHAWLLHRWRSVNNKPNDLLDITIYSIIYRSLTGVLGRPVLM